MADYIQALKKGLQAAEAADRARKEIDSVFEDLNQQLHDGMEGKIAIKRKELEVEKLRMPWEFGTIDYKLIMGLGDPKATYWAIVAYNPKITRSPVRELARWRQDRGGYPCKIMLGKRGTHMRRQNGS